MKNNKKKEFEKMALEMSHWIRENVHPHASAIITTTNYELLEGLIGGDLINKTNVQEDET